MPPRRAAGRAAANLAKGAWQGFRKGGPASFQKPRETPAICDAGGGATRALADETGHREVAVLQVIQREAASLLGVRDARVRSRRSPN